MGDVLSNLKKLPPRCIAEIGGQRVIIQRGVTGYIPVHSASSVYDNLTVSDAQREAMINGCTLGWEMSGADVDENPDATQWFTYHAPFVLQITVPAHSEERAAELTKELAEAMQAYLAPLMDGLYQSFCMDDELQLVETGSLD